MLMMAALTDELSRTTPTTACCRRAETITVLRFAGAVRQEPGRYSIEIDLDTPLLARRLGMAIRTLYGYPTQLQVLHQSRDPAATRHPPQMTRQADAAALARRTGLADPRGQLVHGLPAPLIAGGVCDAAAIWRGAFLVAGSLTEPHRFPALDIVYPSPETAMALTGTARRLGITTRTKHTPDTDRVTVREPDAITALSPPSVPRHRGHLGARPHPPPRAHPHHPAARLRRRQPHPRHPRRGGRRHPGRTRPAHPR